MWKAAFRGCTGNICSTGCVWNKIMIFKMFYFSLKLQVVLKYDDEKGFTKTPKAIDILLPEAGKGRPLGHIPLKELHFLCVCDMEYLDHSFLLISVSLLFIKAGTLGQAGRQLGTLLSESAELSDWSHVAQSDPVSCYIQNLILHSVFKNHCASCLPKESWTFVVPQQSRSLKEAQKHPLGNKAGLLPRSHTFLVLRNPSLPFFCFEKGSPSVVQSCHDILIYGSWHCRFQSL